MQWPIAACSGLQDEAESAAVADGVQCPIAACSGEQVVGGAGVGARAGVGRVQCPIAACSGVHVVAGGGVSAGVAIGEGWLCPLCWASAGLAAALASKARIIRFMLRLRQAGGR